MRIPLDVDVTSFVKISVVLDLLIEENRSFSRGRLIRLDRLAEKSNGGRPPGQSLAEHSAGELAIARRVEAKDLRQRDCDVCVADGRLIDESRLEVRPERGHVVEAVVAAESAVHPLALLQPRVGDLHGSHQAIARIRREGLEVHRDCRTGSAVEPLRLIELSGSAPGTSP